MGRNCPGLNSVMSSSSSEYSFSEPDAFSTFSCVLLSVNSPSVDNLSSGMSLSVGDLGSFFVLPPFLAPVFAEEAFVGSCLTDTPIV